MPGGKRPGSGRPAGSKNKATSLIKDILDSNKEVLMNTAIRLATQKEPNIAVLLKLLDKISPTLSSSSGDFNLNNNSPVGKLDDDQLKNLMANLLKVANKREELINKKNDTKNK